jgi:hypothetical protein
VKVERAALVPCEPDAVHAASGCPNQWRPVMPALAREFHVRVEAHRRIEWGAEGSDYHGWIQVDPDGDGSRLTLFVATARGDAPDFEVMARWTPSAA